jgi:hypothetical protein
MGVAAFTGVDAQTGVLLGHPGGQMAVLFTSLQSATSTTACIGGTDGRIEIDREFLTPTSFRVIDRTGTVVPYRIPHAGRGLRHQVAEVHRCLRGSATESPTMPLDETLSIMDTLDEIRNQIGLRYPAD